MYGPDIPCLDITSLDSDGGQYPINHDQIRSGDLVEVSVQLDVELAQGPPGHCRTSVYLSFNRIVRVLVSERLREVSTFVFVKFVSTDIQWLFIGLNRTGAALFPPLLIEAIIVRKLTLGGVGRSTA